MKTSFIRSQFIFILMVLWFGVAFTSCKKDSVNPDPVPPTQYSDADSLKYLMYQIMQVSFVDGGRDSSFDLPTYYWYSQVPQLNPFSNEYDSADVLLGKMKNYAINPATGRPYDKYSFLDKGQVSDEIQGGVAGDLGMQVSFAYNIDDEIILVVLYADKNSPAGKVGVTRGWQITSINGNEVVYDGSNGPNVQRVIQAIYFDNQATFTFKVPDGSSVTHLLSKSVYQINPVLFDSIYTVAGKQVGYFVFNTFSNVINENGPTLTKQELDRVFSNFESAGITSLIVDLRYNGGGSVNTAEYLDSLIAPSSVGNQLMYRYLYNDKLTARAADIGLQDKVLFKGGGSLNLENVFFIGSDNTASASELTMNNLKPYMNVKLIGDTTYGKPVGFFTFHITSLDAAGNEEFLADLYAINFETVNADGEGGYFNGLYPDAIAQDYVGIPWGDPSDDHLTKIFKYISTGNYGRLSSIERMAKDPTLHLPVRVSMPSLRFSGMVDYKMSNQVQGVINKNLKTRKHK